MSLTNLIIVFTIPFMLYYSTNESVTYLTLGAIFIPIIWFSHRENIKRLKQGKETKIIKF
jgi:glycerol-3-phosphate acyltransferase PlsY